MFSFKILSAVPISVNLYYKPEAFKNHRFLIARKIPQNPTKSHKIPQNLTKSSILGPQTLSKSSILTAQTLRV